MIQLIISIHKDLFHISLNSNYPKEIHHTIASNSSRIVQGKKIVHYDVKSKYIDGVLRLIQEAVE